MKILFLGVFSDPSSADIPRARAFMNFKHDVKCFDYRKKFKRNSKGQKERLNTIKNQFYSQSVIKSIIKSLKNILKKEYSKLIKKIKNYKHLKLFYIILNIHRYYLFGHWSKNRQLINEVKNNKYDLIFLAKAGSINYNIIPILNKYSKTWYFFCDPIKNAYFMDAHKYAKLCTWSSATFTSINNLFRQEGANSYFITEGYNSKVFKPSKKSMNKTFDVIFTGSISPKREKYINFLKKNKINVYCFGKGWENNPIYLEELASNYRKSKIILNFTRGNIGFSDRVFLSMGTGTLLLTEYCNDIGKLFKKKIHLDWFKTPEELLKLINFYLKNDELREKLSQQGEQFVRKHYTWEKIVEKILKIVEKNK